MRKLITLAMLAVLLCPVLAGDMPSIRGLVPFTAQTKFMSLEGYLRWQYFVENKVWVSRSEAEVIVTSQLPCCLL